MKRDKKPEYTRAQREKAKKAYQDWENITNICKIAGITRIVCEYMINNISTFRIRTLANWEVEKKCLWCCAWKNKEENYNKSGFTPTWTQLYKSICKYCTSITIHNDRVLWKIDYEKAYVRNKKRRDTNWKWYFAKRKARLIAEWKREKYLSGQRISQKRLRKKRKEKRS